MVDVYENEEIFNYSELECIMAVKLTALQAHSMNVCLNRADRS